MAALSRRPVDENGGSSCGAVRRALTARVTQTHQAFARGASADFDKKITCLDTWGSRVIACFADGSAAVLEPERAIAPSARCAWGRLDERSARPVAYVCAGASTATAAGDDDDKKEQLPGFRVSRLARAASLRSALSARRQNARPAVTLGKQIDMVRACCERVARALTTRDAPWP
jgi:hypothetical protein